MPVLRLDPERVAGGRGEGEIENALSWACEHIAAGPVLIAASAKPEAVAQIQQRYGRDSSGYAIEQAMASIAGGLIEAGVRRLIVAGGETAGAVVGRLGIPAFQVGPELAPGVPVLRSLGYGKLELLMALKSGNFGASDFFEKALAVMK
jgi:3-dehydrotetronate 4-kinase